MANRTLSRYLYPPMKRLLDVMVALVGLVVLSPVMLAIGVAVFAKLGRPVLFSQVRPGRGGVPFRILKFRTMCEPASTTGEKLSDKDRLSDFGRWLRSTSLDELPELVNIVKGEMSLVGPRPLLMEYLDLYTPEQMRRHEVRPGLTGWAQIHGRNAITWEERFALDLWYVENRSIWLDLRILFRTVQQVVGRADISHPSHVTMEPFRGTPPAGRGHREV